MPEIALIVGAGSGLSASLARLLAREGMKVALAARNADKVQPLADEIGGMAWPCDATEPGQVAGLFSAVESKLGVADLTVFNAGYRTRGPLVELDVEEVRKTLISSAFGGFLVGQAAARSLLRRGHGGTIIFTGASASVKGYPKSAPFAMGKFALRGLAESMARELQPQNIHVGHVVIDGGIANPGRDAGARGADGMLSPDAIAENFLHLHRQHRSAWSWEIAVRPWVENF
ncbi:MAG TPA: SDR family NAD(P)-dependent oxidoreductase [Stellaceae bacterium]|nr:SDR family NAD(P)-dependent oxidoreductase [Stellaceae bacterium]